MARAIVEYRNQHGPFKSIFDLNKVFDHAVQVSPDSATDLTNAPFASPLDKKAQPASFQGGSATSLGANPPTYPATELPLLDFRYSRRNTPISPPTVTPAPPNLNQEIDARQGDFFPTEITTVTFPKFSGKPPTDGVVGDFKEKFLAMTRISNLITTRSDSFTCYVLVQGWRNAGTNNAELVSQKRAAFVIDRSKLSETNTTPEIPNVPIP